MARRVLRPGPGYSRPAREGVRGLHRAMRGGEERGADPVQQHQRHHRRQEDQVGHGVEHAHGAAVAVLRLFQAVAVYIGGNQISLFILIMNYFVGYTFCE
mgnify:CR=1 FL=1